jgi:hypothetical protein
LNNFAGEKLESGVKGGKVAKVAAVGKKKKNEGKPGVGGKVKVAVSPLVEVKSIRIFHQKTARLDPDLEILKTFLEIIKIEKKAIFELVPLDSEEIFAGRLPILCLDG